MIYRARAPCRADRGAWALKDMYDVLEARGIAAVDVGGWRASCR